MKLKGFAIVSIILLAILTFGAVNAADNATVDDLTVVSDSEDFVLSSPSEEIIDEDGITSSIASGDIPSDNRIDNLGASNNDEIIITPDNLSKSNNQVENGSYKFIGDFNRPFSYLSFESGCRIDATQARFIDMGIVLAGDVQINGLTISATHFNQFFEDALIYVTGDDNILVNLNVEYLPDNGHDVYAILLSSANDFQLLNSTINFTGSSLSKNYEYAMKIVSCIGGLIQLNTIQANLPILDVDYEKGDPGLATDLVLNTGIKESNNIDVIGNTFIAKVTNRVGDFPTLDCVMLESCENINIISNIFKESDFVTPINNTNYLNVLDMYYSSHILVKGNDLSVETDGGSLDAGTAYPIQICGPYEDVLIDGNDIYARSGGPALGIYSQNYYGDTEILVQNNNIDVTGFSSLNSWGLVSGIELQDNKARVYNNTIKTKSITGSYVEGMKLYGISYAQALNDNHNYDIRSNNIETEGKYAIYLLKAENTNITDNYLVSSTGVGDQTIYVVNASGNTVIRDNRPNGAAKNIVNASNFDDFFGDDGILKDDVEFDELIFKGQFNALRECLYITKALTITGDEAVLNNMAINVMSDDVKLDKLTLNANICLGNLINVEGSGVDLTNLKVSYSPGSEEAIGVYIHDCGDVRLLNSTIFFESHVVDDEHKSIAVQMVNTQNLLIDLNNITTKLPAVTVNNYDDDYYVMGLCNVNPVLLKDCSNLVFTRNNIDSTTNRLIAEFPTIQSIYIIGCSDSLIDCNNISMIDRVTPVGRDNYMYGIVFGFNVNVTFSHNDFLMITSGGKDAAGTDYAFQGVESEVIIKGNNIVSRSNGPNLGIYVASLSGGDSKLLIEDNVINVTGYSSSKGTWALVSGIEIQNGDAQIYNNTIYVYNVNSYDDNAYMYGISYAQWMYGDRSFDIRNNTVYTEGKYAVSVINATSLIVENNELYAHELAGDDSVNLGACENISIKRNNYDPDKHKITIDVNDCWFGNDNQANITVANAMGNITIKVNGKEVANEEIDSTVTYVIQAEDIVLGKNIIEVIYDGIESKSASFVAFDAVSVIEISMGPTSVGYDVPVTVSILGATGNVTVIVDGKEHLIELKDGIATHTIEKITSGKHDITVVYFGDDNKLPAINTTVFSVGKLDPLVLISPIGLQYSKKAFTIKVRNETAVNITINGKSYELINGVVNIDNGLDAGEYVVLVTSAETEKYYAHSTAATFKVVKQTSNIESVSVPTGDVIIGQNATVKVTMASEETGDVLININGVNYIASISDKIAILNVNLPVNDYAVVVTYLGDDKYNASVSRNAEFRIVDKSKTDIAITISGDVEVGGEITIAATATSGEKVTLTVNGIELKDGKYTIESAGSYDVVAVSDENNAYHAGFNKTTFKVEKSNSAIGANPVSAKQGDAIALEINVTDGATGIVLVDVENNRFYGDINNGKATVNLIGLVAGNYSALITYLGDANFNECSSNVDINVTSKEGPAKEDVDMDIGVPAGLKVGEEAIVNVTFQSDAKGTVAIFVDGNKIDDDNVTEGVVSVSLDKLTAGIHVIEVRYSGDEKYCSKDETKEIFVAKLNTTVNAGAVEITEGETATIIVDFVDGASGIVLVDVGGKQFYGIIDSGKASVEAVGLTASDYTAKIIYQGDAKFNEASTTVDVKVKAKSSEKTRSVISITGVNGTFIYGILKDHDGNSIANAVVDYMINNNKSSAVTNSDGTFTIEGQKGVKIIISYAGDNNTLAYNTSITIDDLVPVRIGTTILGSDFAQYAVEYGAGERGNYFKVQLKDANGKVLANKVVSIGYNGKKIQKTTDANGYISEQINLNDAKVLTFTAAFLGDDNYDATMSVYSITTNKKPVKIVASAKKFKASAKTKKYTVTLKSVKGASIDGKTYFGKGKKVTLKLNGKTYSAKTNSKGQATFTLKITKKGKFTASIKYDGSTTYKSVSKSVKITIK